MMMVPKVLLISTLVYPSFPCLNLSPSPSPSPSPCLFPFPYPFTYLSLFHLLYQFPFISIFLFLLFHLFRLYPSRSSFQIRFLSYSPRLFLIFYSIYSKSFPVIFYFSHSIQLLASAINILL
jgi:hypothetical protein